MSAMREHDWEPVPGLPESLPPGERMLWQGAPSWRTLARRVFHVRKLAFYFAILVAWRSGSLLLDGAGWADAAAAALWMAGLSLAVIGLAALFAWLVARSTVYTITDRRVVLRYGVALPMCLNLPFRRIHAVGLRRHPDGSGDIALTLSAEGRVAYLHLWPHARPWRISRPEPALRGIPDAAGVGEILADALSAAAAPAPTPTETRTPSPARARASAAA